MIAPFPERKAFTCTINTTEDCNLACRYCYETNKRPRSIPLGFCKAFVDFLVQDDDPALLLGSDDEWARNAYKRGLTLEFIGGDSLVDVGLLDRIIKYLMRKLATTDSRNAMLWRDNWRISISTNGTLFLRPEVRAFCERYRDVLSLSVSIDGCPAIHDRNRVYKDGRGTMRDILRSWSWYRSVFPELSRQTKATCNKDSIPFLRESLAFMHEELGLTCIRQNFIMEDTRCAAADLEEFRRQMDLCVDYVLAHRDNLYWSMIDRQVFAGHHLSRGRDWTHKGHCGSGMMPALSVDGKIYPCFRWLPHTQEDKSIAVGSVTDMELDKEAFRKVAEGSYRCNCTKDPKCRECEFESACSYCIGGCYAEFGEFRRTTHICGITKIQCGAAKKYWEKYEEEKEA